MILQGLPARFRPLVVAAFVLLMAWWGLASERTPYRPAHAIASLAAGLLMTSALAIAYLWEERAGRREQAVILVVVAASSVALVALQPGGPGPLGVFFTALWASQGGRLAEAAALAAGAAYLGLVARAQPPPSPLTLIGLALGLVAAYLVPLLRRELERQQREQAAVQERERLAREIHDVLAHTLSALTMQLEGARLLMARQPDDPRAREAVERAHRLAVEGFEEARRAVSTLRGDVLPGPDLLPALAESFQHDSGVPCRFELEGSPVPLRPDARLAVYRTAQEALSNVRKHVQASQVSVRLRYVDGGAELTVSDRGTARASPAPGGHGLTGIRERARLLGGRLEAGPVDGGFEVRLWVPA